MSVKVRVSLELVELVVLWRVLILLKSKMAWQVSVMSVMDVVSSISELIWIVESIQFISRSLHVVLNAITVKVVDSSLSVKVLL